MSSAVASSPPPQTISLFAARVTQLERVSVNLRMAYREHARCMEAEKRQKAAIYLASDARSHGEREGLASAQAVDWAVETLNVKAEISALEEERDFLRFIIEYDIGE